MSRPIRVLVACERSGVVREAFRRHGYDAWSNDLVPADDGSPYHIQSDALTVLDQGWDLMIAHPPCTYLSRAGARWWRFRENEAQEAGNFVRKLYEGPVANVAIENPIGRLNQMWRYPDQTIEPWQFGDPFRKRTCLWLKGLPPLMASVVHPEHGFWVHSTPKHRKGAVSGARELSQTFPGIAEAMAEQWGNYVAALAGKRE